MTSLRQRRKAESSFSEIIITAPPLAVGSGFVAFIDKVGRVDTVKREFICSDRREVDCIPSYVVPYLAVGAGPFHLVIQY